MITEDYVSFETAKLLKEKGFNIQCWMYYSPDTFGPKRFHTQRKGNSQLIPEWEECVCPTLQMAMKWLREVHHIFIALNVVVNGIYFSLCRYKELSGDGTINYKPQPVSPTYEEAAEVAIKYCLENLI